MKKTKENKGITLITIVISVVLMTILVSVVTYSGIRNYKNAQVTKFVAQMQLIQTRVDELVSANEYSNFGSSATSYQNIITAAYGQEEIITSSAENFKYFSIEDLKDNLDLENIDTDVLINFNTREVVAVDGIEYQGTTYYTQYKLPQGQTLIGYNGARGEILAFQTPRKEINGLNCLVKLENIPSNCTLVYGEGADANEVTNWKTISKYTKQGEVYSTNITKDGNYIFKLIDNTNNEEIEQSVNVVLTNKPKTNSTLSKSYDYALGIDNWGYENYYIWIPRFAYNNNDNSQIKYIKGNSNIATDGTYLDLMNWTVPDKFTDNTGIWIQKAKLNQNMEELSAQLAEMDKDIEKVAYVIRNTDIPVRINLIDTSNLEDEVFGIEGETVYDGTNYNRTTIALFSQANINRDVIIEFNINSVNTTDIIDAPTLLGAMDEVSTTNTYIAQDGTTKKMYPGFNVKLDGNTKDLKIESNSYRARKIEIHIPTETENVRILRMDNKLYYSFDYDDFVYMNDFSENQGQGITPFDAPVTFGAGLNEKGYPRRFFKGIIEDVSIRFIDAEATVENYGIEEEEEDQESIIDDAPELTTVYAHERAIEFIPNGNGNPSQMVDYETREPLPVNEYQHDGMIFPGVYTIKSDTMVFTPLSMFEETTIDTDFEISFVIKHVATKNEGQVEQGAILNVKYEKKGWKKVDWPGFVYRVTKDRNSLELTAKGQKSTGSLSLTSVSDMNTPNETYGGHKITISRKNRIVYFSVDDATEIMAFNFSNFSAYFHNVPITIGGSLNNEGIEEDLNAEYNGIPFRGFKGVLSNIIVKVEE